MFHCFRTRQALNVDSENITNKYDVKLQICQFIVFHCFRTGQALSVHSEKTSEAMLLEAIQKTVASLPGFEIKDYTSTEAVNLRQQHAEKGKR